MSLITLEEAKAFLNVIHASDDDKLQALLDGAEQEALDFMNRENFGGLCPCLSDDYAYVLSLESEFDESSEAVSSEPDALPQSVRTGILFALQGAYQASPDEWKKLREAAEVLWMPYRCGLGV